MLPEDFKHQLLQANPIETVAGSYVQLQRSGDKFRCRCPFHSDGTPSCYFYPSNNSFYCFGCHVGGDTITFVMQIENLNFMQAVEHLAARAGMKVPEASSEDRRMADYRNRLLELNRAAGHYYIDKLKGTDARGRNYLVERRANPVYVRKYGLGYADDAWDNLAIAMKAKGYTEQELLDANLCSRGKGGKLYDRFRSRIIFPILDLKGSVIAFGGRTIDPDGNPKYLNSSDTPVFKKGKQLFSLNFAKNSQSKRLILAEGYMDVLAIHQAGFENVVASLGTALTPDQCRLMRQYAEEVIIAYDSDFAGQNATMKAINLLRQAGLQPRILRMQGAKDPDEYIKKFGSAAFRQLLEDAEDAIHYQIERCRDGLDPNADLDKITMLQRIVTVLANIENPLDQGVYLSRVAKEYEIDPEVLKAQIQKEKGRRIAGDRKMEWQVAITNVSDPQPSGNVEGGGNRRVARAERELLCYLFRNPNACGWLTKALPPSQFTSPLHRRILERFIETLENGFIPDISSYSEDFTSEELGYLVGILAKYEQIHITDEAVQTCISLVSEARQNETPAQELDDEAFAERFKQLRRDKRRPVESI